MPLLLSPVPVRHSKQAPAAQAAGPPCLPSESSLVAHHPRREPSPDLDTDTDTAILSWFLCDHFEGLLGALTGITGRATSTGTDTAKTGNRSPHSSHHIHSHSSHLPSLSTPKSFKGLQEPTPDPRPDHFGGGEPGSNSLRTDRHVNGPAASSSHQQQQQWIPRTESAVSCATLYCTEYYQVISSTSAGDLLSSALPTIPVQPNHLLVTSVPVLSNSDESDTDCDSDLGVPHPSPVSLAAPTFEMLPKCTSPGILLATPTSESSAVEVVVTAVPACSRRQEREAALALCGTFPELVSLPCIAFSASTVFCLLNSLAFRSHTDTPRSPFPRPRFPPQPITPLPPHLLAPLPPPHPLLRPLLDSRPATSSHCTVRYSCKDVWLRG